MTAINTITQVVKNGARILATYTHTGAPRAIIRVRYIEDRRFAYNTRKDIDVDLSMHRSSH